MSGSVRDPPRICSDRSRLGLVTDLAWSSVTGRDSKVCEIIGTFALREEVLDAQLLGQRETTFGDRRVGRGTVDDHGMALSQ